VAGLKETIPAQAPLAVFADIDTLAAAPQAMIAAGFGDILGKITALADWELEHLIWGDPYDAAVAASVQAALQRCIESVDAIANRSVEGIQYLIEALLESGRGMLAFGNSRPASGAEHQCSHYWEIKLLAEGRPALLHGAKVGFATTLVAEQYALLRQMSRSQLIDQLEGAQWPSREAQVAEIERMFGPISSEIIRIQEPYLAVTADRLDEIRRHIVDHWDAIQIILATVPPAEEITQLLARVGGPNTAQALNLTPADVEEALRYGHYLRRRFSVMKLLKLLDVEPQIEVNQS
jgi:glycerol-1-phosphate dehydrogenase [NAD(P)+]